MLCDASRAEELKAEAIHLPSWDLNVRQICDNELLLNGALSPLTGYLGCMDYDSVCQRMRLANGTLWPMPITLDVTEVFAEKLSKGDQIALRHPEGILMGVLRVSDIWKPDRRAECEAVFGTADELHPGVFQLINQTNPVYVGGRLEGVEIPPYHTFRHLRYSPEEMRREFARRGWDRVVAFQTQKPMHRAQVELTHHAAAKLEAHLLLHPVVGRMNSRDFDYFSNIRCYQAILDQYPSDLAMLSLLPLMMRMAGPRETLWHTLINKNYGCTHFIVCRDHAAAGNNRQGQPFYGPGGAQELVKEYEPELGIEVVAMEEMLY